MMKTKRIQKWLAVALGLVMTTGVAACGTNVSGQSQAEPAEQKTATSSKEDTKKEEKGEEVLTADNFNIDDVKPFTIRVGVNSSDDNQYLKILDDHTGFLKDRGIDLVTTEFAAGINTIDAITTGQLDVGLFADYAGVNRIGNTLADTELRAFATIKQTTAYDLWVNPETIKEPKDLEGKIGISQAGVVFEYEYGKLFQTYDLDKSKVEIVNVQSVQEALSLAATGGADAYWTHQKNAQKFEEVGWEPLVSIADIDATMFTFLVANDSYLREHQAEVAKFLAVSEEGFAYITEHLDEFADWVEADIGLAKDIVKKGWETESHGYTFKQEAYEDLDKVEKWCAENGNFPKAYDVADFINTDALALIHPDLVTWSAK